MIPLQLKIRNFLSYGTQGEIIDFEPHHLICLTGKNGHGKSALLDAITWALWGQARKVAGVTRGDEHLVRLGESGMSVTLDFSCGGQRYRATRDFSMAHNKKGISQLHLGLFKDDIDAYVSLSEKNMRDTQEKLDAIVGLDYDTFINSVFLRQGQANEFSKKSPLERKEILCALLGLTRYEELRKRALEHQRNYEKEHEVLSHLTRSMTDELKSKEEVIEQATSIEKQLALLTQTQTEKSCALESLVTKQQQTAYAQTALALAMQSLDQQTRAHTQCTKALVDLLDERREYQHRKSALDIGALALAQESATKKLVEYETVKNIQMTLKEKLLNLSTERQRRLTAMQEELQAQLQNATEKLNQARFAAERAESSMTETVKKLAATELQKRELAEKKVTLERSLAGRETANKKTGLLEEQLTREARFIERWQLRAQQSSETHEVARERHRNLQTHDSVCPLCTQPLPETQRAMLIAQAQRTAKRLDHQSARLARLIKRLGTQIKLHEKELKKQLLEKDELTRNAEQLIQTDEHLVQIASTLALITSQVATGRQLASTSAMEAQAAQITHAAAVAALTDVPARDAILSAYTQEITTLTTQLTTIEKDLLTVDPTRLRRELVQINEQQKAVALMGHEQTQNRKRSREICTIIGELRTIAREQETLKKSVTSLKPVVDELLANDMLVKNLRQELEKVQQRKQALFEQKGALARQIAVFEKRAQELIVHQEKIKQLEELIEDHQLLAQALSKNGIQALIIEQAVPELESEANELLARLTENQAQVMFESLRDLKSGGSKETLDIKISDAMGTRPYELFSGGEAFRIDFALRIALSKLLARRSGTSLQTLIIDEGFGSQDEEGLVLIQEALHTIQGDFEKVIVVSHLPAMKHQFPTNFVVRKGAEGSTVSVVQQG